jgi:hypothetical protein
MVRHTLDTASMAYVGNVLDKLKGIFSPDDMILKAF